MKKPEKEAHDCLIEVLGNEEGAVIFVVSGRLALTGIEVFMTTAGRLLSELSPVELQIDLGGLTYLDSSGALALISLQMDAHAQSIPFRFTHAGPQTAGILGLIDPEILSVSPLIAERQSSFLEYVGEQSLKFVKDVYAIMSFMGELIVHLLASLCRPLSVPWGTVLFYMRRTGVDGLPIVGLISFLLGLIIAFMSALQLKQFGASIYIAPLVAVAMVRELGPIMTAILVAGRSGSAFAAEIGTMKVNEEVDALVAMGINPMRFLSVPKVIAAAIVVPLLTVYSWVFGVAGGLAIGVTFLDLTVFTYINETLRSLSAHTVVVSLAKSLVFAVLIAGIGCQRGFQVRGGAEAVGSATTSAVVAGILLVMVADSAFAVILQYT